ncbi:hypothetical protein GCM10027516_29940 [Niabella aquatica]
MSGCQKFLDVKPDKQLVEPSIAEDLQAMLNYEAGMNNGYPAQAEIWSDNYWLSTDNYNSLTTDNQLRYLWNTEATSVINESSWWECYEKLFTANLVIEYATDLLKRDAMDPKLISVLGQAYFFRSWILYNIALIWTPPYNADSNNNDPGIPLRLASDINAKTTRSTLKETFNQILSDARRASELLGNKIVYKVRPSKPAAFGLLAKVYLYMGDSKNAGIYADSCLAIYDSLMDYNSLNASANAPIPLQNKEILFNAQTNSGTNNRPITYQFAKVDTLLFKEYAADDLRKVIYFGRNSDNSYYFKGNYNNLRTAANFNGIVVDEIYLISAESAARQKKYTVARELLHKLLKTRWRTQSLSSFNDLTGDELLDKIMQERRKTLCFRSGIRWSDLKRFQFDERYFTEPQRNVAGKTAVLKKGDVRYAGLIPQSVIHATGIEQNAR